MSTITRLGRIAGVTAVSDLRSPGRVSGALFLTVIPIALTVAVWNALYADVDAVAGVTRDQAVTYAVIAAMATYLRVGAREWMRDAPAEHIRTGTIVYWFVRPFSPARYHLVRAVGDLGYSFSWLAAAYGVCLAVGAIAGPRDAMAGALALVSFALGQAVVYLLALLLDQCCFWTLINAQIIQVVGFAQTLLSGGFAPLWFFPEWFQALSRWLPFEAIVNTPLSIYAGRVDETDALLALARQAAWVLALGAFAAWLWRRIPDRLEVQGG